MQRNIKNAEELVKEFILYITDIPKEITCRKLKAHIHRQVGESNWHLQQWIPLEDCNLAQIICNSKLIYRRIFCINDLLMTSRRKSSCIKIVSSNTLQLQPIPCSINPPNSILHLTHDSLILVFEKFCTLKSQIALAKACQQFYTLISNIWRRKHKTFYYNLYEFECKQQLSATEIQEFCSVVGPNVTHLIFCTAFHLPILQNSLCYSRGNLMTNAKNYINAHLCRNLEYFYNLEMFEVEGKFLTDFTVQELARYCKKLRVFRLLDVDTRWMSGKFLKNLKELEVLGLRDCKNYQAKSLNDICQWQRLQELDIVELQSLNMLYPEGATEEGSKHPLQLKANCLTNNCINGNLATLRVLKLNALPNNAMLAVIMTQLPNLQQLQFYWLNNCPFFETLLLSTVAMFKSKKLVNLRMVNECLFVDNATQQSLNAHNYALMREKVVLAADAWSWRPTTDLFKDFVNLESITFEYCRLLQNNNLLRMPSACGKLKLIKLIGCVELEDTQLLHDWAALLERNPRCQLTIESLVSLQEMQELRAKQHILKQRTSYHDSPILRSIECGFN